MGLHPNRFGFVRLDEHMFAWLLLADTYANATRIEKIVNILDTGEPYQPEKCGTTPKADR